MRRRGRESRSRAPNTYGLSFKMKGRPFFVFFPAKKANDLLTFCSFVFLFLYTTFFSLNSSASSVFIRIISE